MEATMSRPPNRTATRDGAAWRYRILRGKHGVTGLQVGIETADVARFVLRREGWFDRVGKRLGLAREWQTSDEQFDGRVYIQSDDVRLHEALSLDTALRAAILALLQLPRVSRIQMQAGVLWIQAGYDRQRDGKGRNEELTLALAGEVLPLLQTVARQLARQQAPEWERARDPGLTRYRVALTAALVLGFAGLLALLVMRTGTRLPRALLFEHIHARALQTALLLLVIAVPGVLWLLGRRARTHFVIAALLFVTAPGAWCAAAAYFERTNNRGAVPATPFLAQVTDLRREQRKNRYTYRVEFAAMPDPRMSRRLSVSAGLWQQLAIGQCVNLDIRSGTLGDPWLAGIEAASC